MLTWSYLIAFCPKTLKHQFFFLIFLCSQNKRQFGVVQHGRNPYVLIKFLPWNNIPILICNRQTHPSTTPISPIMHQLELLKEGDLLSKVIGFFTIDTLIWSNDPLQHSTMQGFFLSLNMTCAQFVSMFSFAHA